MSQWIHHSLKRSRALLAVCLLASCHCGNNGFTRVSRTALAETAVDLGRPFVGDVATATLAINSTGRGAVNVTRIASTNDALTLDWVGAPTGHVTPSGTLEITITWRPTAPEQLTGTIEIDLETDDPTQRHQVAQVTGESRELPSCDDGNSCTDDVFNRQTEQCRHTNTTNTCDDGNACTEEDRCQEGSCRGVARSCDDHNVCTLNLCDPAAGCVFPPDGRICADDDPCTKDVCDPSGGCQHPNADDGTACGPFSCAIAHLCIFGGCRELDITGSSDGFPCSDGDACTESDTCRFGACAPGPLRDSGPEIVATLDTYGGEGSFVTTDGFRYLFVDRDTADDPEGLRVTTWDGQTLTPAGSLSLLASAAPEMVVPGKFVVPHEYSLALVNATDVDNPVIVWDVPLSPTFPMEGIITVAAVHRMTGGLLALVETRTSTQRTDSTLYFVPLDNDLTMPPRRFVRIAQAPSISDVDANDDVLAYGLPNEVVWMRLGSMGQVVQSEVIPFPGTTRVTVEDTMVGVLRNDAMEVLSVDQPGRQPVTCESSSNGCLFLEPGCDGTFPFPASQYQLCSPNALSCPVGSHCEQVSATDGRLDVDCRNSCCAGRMDVCFTPLSSTFPLLAQSSPIGVKDILLMAGGFYRATDEGVWAGRLFARDPQPDAVIDPVPATGLERGRNNLLVSGRVALALTPTGGAAKRITGPGLGEITALVDENPTKILLAGSMALGELDVPTGKFTNWKTPDLATGPTRVRVLNGSHRTAVVPSVGNEPSFGAATCSLTQVEVIAGMDQVESNSVCNLPPTSMTSTPGRVWAQTKTAPNPIGGEVSSWSLPATAAFPDVAIPDGSNSETIGVRSSEDGASVGVLQYDYTFGTSRLYSLEVASQSVTREYGLEADATARPANADAFAVDGAVAISASWQSARLHPRLALGETPPTPELPLPSVLLPNAHLSPPIRVAAMSHGKAWLGWKQERRQLFSQTILSELRYDAQGMTIEDKGSVDIRGMVNAVYDAGEYTVAATNSAVVIVAPSCRR